MKSFNLNERGQAFSTFQLLIAAIVAIIILTFLLGILGFIPDIGATNDPGQTANNSLRDAIRQPGQLKVSNTISIPSGYFFSSKSISGLSDAGLAPEQICIHPGENLDLTAVENEPIEPTDPTLPKNAWQWKYTTEEGYSLSYLGSFQINQRLKVVCSPRNEISVMFSRYTDNVSGLEIGWISDAPILQSSIDNQSQKVSGLQTELALIETELATLNSDLVAEQSVGAGANQTVISNLEKQIKNKEKEKVDLEEKIVKEEEKLNYLNGKLQANGGAHPKAVNLTNNEACHVIDPDSTTIVCMLFLAQDA